MAATIFAGQLLLEDSGSSCRITPGVVRIVDDYIYEVIEGEIPQHFDIGGADWLIAPGFVDSHLHLPQFEMIGGHGLPLLDWLGELTFPAERRWEDTDFARSMAKRVFGQCLAHGTTSICAYATVHADATAAVLQLAESIGLGGVIGQVLMDRQAPPFLCRRRQQLIDEAATLLDRFPPSCRMAAAVTPRFAITCSPELLAEAGKLGSSRGAIIQTHLAETIPECARVKELFGGQNYVSVYQAAGLITPQTIFGHGIYLAAEDRRQLATGGAMIAHCPTANSFLRSGTMDRAAAIDAAVKLTLGSDIGAGYERSMVRVARAMIEAAARIGESYPTAAQAWHTITAGNADAIGLRDIGRLRVGGSADLLAIAPDVPWLDSPVDPLAMLMFAWDDRWIKSVLLRGHQVV